MNLDPKLAELLAQPGVLVLAMDSSAARTVPIPAELQVDPDRVIDAAAPLDALDPNSHGPAVVAYEHARRHGSGAGEVELVNGQGPYWLEIIALMDGDFLGVLSPSASRTAEHGGAAHLPPRRAAYELDVSGVIVSASPEFEAMLGLPTDAVVGHSALDIIHPDDQEAGIVAWVELLAAPDTVTRLRQRFKTVDGNWLWCEATEWNTLDSAEPPVVMAELVDISREVAAQAALQRRETLLDRLSRSLPSGIIYTDDEGETAVSNDRWEELTGLPADAGVAALVDRVDEPEAILAAIERAEQTGSDENLDVTFVAGEGSCQFGTLHLRPVHENDRRIGLLVTLDDVTSLRLAKKQLEDQSRRDPLTGALNRLGIEEAVTAKIDSGDAAVIFVDLDQFKVINDTHGHAVGDEVLQEVARGISGLLRDGDSLGRIGGDEFLVLLAGSRSARHAETVARRIGELLPTLADAVAARVTIAASVGTARAMAYDDFDTLIGRADAAMYVDKRNRAGERREATEHDGVTAD
ncbi:MAG: sensor domain-containing diguanylate cyclase [Actinomycetota bacterium]